METRFDDFRRRLEKKVGELTKGQKAVANFILAKPEKFALSSIREVEDELRTSKATVVRLAQTLGYKGFKELRLNFRECIQQGLSPFARYKEHLIKSDQAGQEGAPAHLQALADETIINIHRTLNLVNEAQCQEAVRILKNARRVYILGLGISSFLADIAAYMFNLVSLSAQAMNYKGLSFAEQLINVSKEDVLLAFSFKHYSPETIDCARLAREKDIKLLAITDEGTSMIVPYSTLHFQVASESISVSNSIMAALVLVYALVYGLGHDLKEKTVKILEELEDIRGRSNGRTA
jgi:DNA-binding MurR/RpiR family transcriptional regulator